MRSRGVLIIAMASSCTSSGGGAADASSNDSSDASVDAALADAGLCPTLEPVCDGDFIYYCTVIGASPTRIERCPAGCVTSASPHCGVIQPSGVVSSSDIDGNATLAAVVVPPAGAVIDSDTGAISGVRAPGTGIIAGVGYEIRAGIAVFRFGDLRVDGPVTVTGTHAVAWTSNRTIQVSAMIDLTGTCIDGAAGPGGEGGGAPHLSATAPGGGAAGASGTGGGGGSHGSRGGSGGPSQSVTMGGAPGLTVGGPAILSLRGGAGGGGGAGFGGGGAGAIQLVARDEVVFSSTGTSAGIAAGGCGGRGSSDGGGGGGAGGAILIEAPRVDLGISLTSYVVAGGGGGGYAAQSDGASGNQGSRGGQNGGGDGAFTLPAQDGSSAGTGGGGGGGAGWMRFNYVKQLRASNATLVPPFGETTTSGIAGVD